MNRDDAIRKIKACLALSKSANPGEAAAALRQARKLADQLGIDEGEVRQADVQEQGVALAALAVQAWEGELAGAVATAFGCELYLTQQHRDAERLDFTMRRVCMFVGVAPAHELAGYAFEVLWRQCLRQRMAHVKAQPKACKPATKRARGDAFALGWVRGVVHLLDGMPAPEADAQLVKGYMARKHPNLGAAKLQRRDVGRNVKPESFSQGHQAGRQAKLHAGVGQQSGPLLLGR